MEADLTIEKARPEDLEVMRQCNMHHVPSPEMEELDSDCMFVARASGLRSTCSVSSFTLPRTPLSRRAREGRLRLAVSTKT